MHTEKIKPKKKELLKLTESCFDDLECAFSLIEITKEMLCDERKLDIPLNIAKEKIEKAVENILKIQKIFSN